MKIINTVRAYYSGILCPQLADVFYLLMHYSVIQCANNAAWILWVKEKAKLCSKYYICTLQLFNLTIIS
jgi:hypothetical protein